MRSKRIRGVNTLALVVSAAALGGCVGVTATPGVQGKAYVVKGSTFGTTMYHCESDSGDPKCYQVKEMERGE